MLRLSPVSIFSRMSEDGKFNYYMMQETAYKYAAFNLSVIPLNYDKSPNLKSWKPFQEAIPNAFQINEMFIKGTAAIGIIGGKVSGNLEILDEDLKYDLTGTLHDEFIERLNESAPGLYKKLLIQKTRNNGFHYPYYCEVIEGNLKLASRPASEEERQGRAWLRRLCWRRAGPHAAHCQAHQAGPAGRASAQLSRGGVAHL